MILERLSNSSRDLSRLALTGLAIALLTACANSHPPFESEAGARSAALEEARKKLTEQEARLLTLGAELATTRQALDACRLAENGLRARINDMESKIQTLERDLSAAQSQATLLALRRENQRLREELSEQTARAAGLNSQLNENQAVLATAAAETEALRAELSQNETGFYRDLYRSNPNAMAANQRLTEVDAEEPLLKKVFYATNRARLTDGKPAGFSNFLLPLALLVLFFVAPPILRYLLKERFERRAIFLARLLIGIPLAIFLLLAVRATLQASSDNRRLDVQYGNQWRKPQGEELAYELGTLEVSIPPGRKAGEVPLPDLVRFEFVANPERHFQLASITPAGSNAAFYDELRKDVAASGNKDLFVFVHGFHNTFQDAAFRTAQIAHDMGFKGAPMFFSWPSQGNVLDYFTDASNVDISIEHLKHFLQAVHDESGAERIHLLAHSMGSRALSRAVLALDEQYKADSRFNELVFAAPDIRAERLSQMAAGFMKSVDRVTLYASAHDSALQLSRALQGRNEEDYQRAGETSPEPLIAPPIDTIDVSRVSSGHSYVSNSGHVLDDLGGVLMNNRELNESFAEQVTGLNGGTYWVLR